MNTRQYVKLGWLKDKEVRDTGPYIDGKYYGTHPAVRVYYSPGIMSWLMGGRTGKIADGEMIIKEQYAAARDAQSRQNGRRVMGLPGILGGDGQGLVGVSRRLVLEQSEQESMRC